MFPFATELDSSQVIAATRFMLRIAATDTVQPGELELIRGFYDGCRPAGDAWPAFDPVLAQSANPFHLDPATFPAPAQRELLLSLGFMAAYGDGALTAGEQQLLDAAARDLGVSESRVGEIAAVVQDHLLGQFARLPDAGSVARVAKEM
jgi:hypothetical protein